MADQDWSTMSDEDFLKAPPPEDLGDVFVEGDFTDPMEDSLEGPDSNSESDHTTPHHTTESDAEDGADAAGEQAPAAEADVEETDTETPDTKTPGAEDAEADTTADDEAGSAEEGASPGSEEEAAQGEGEAGEAGSDAGDEGDGDGDTAGDGDGEPNYKALYEELMQPFKANGKEFKPENPEEIRRLAQQGANYVKKMTALKPNMRMMRMLQNNNLLDEEKLTHLIDVARGDAAAIQKLLKEKGVDTMSLDDQEAEYRPGDHTVTDEELSFHSTLEDVMASSDGKELVSEVNRTWDRRSKEEVYKDPAILTLMLQHREDGIYDRITTEMDRQKTLGKIPDHVPFLEAYQKIGDALNQRGQLLPKASEQGQETHGSQPAAPARTAQSRQPVASSKTRRKEASNGDRARAASPTRTAPKAPPKQFDPFSMTDEEIMAATAPKI